MKPEDRNPYKDVRSLVRGLRVIEMLSELGWAKVGELSAAAGIQRSSAYRLVNTLEQLGYVTRRSDDGAVALTTKFAYLADALKDDDIVTQFAWPSLFELSKDVLWPCDFASFEGGKVLIRLSTHKISPMSIHRGMVGKERYLMRSALGLAILSGMAEDELESSLSIIERMGGSNAEDVRNRETLHRTLDTVRARGYASSAGQTEAKISAIAMPVRSAQERVAGAVNIVFFRSVMTTEQAADRYLEKLRMCVREVERSLKDFAERNSIAGD
ncbi:helix-turn-helix domain-containing protein [Sphingobium sp. JS3065]|jgi:IclR family mhp operon transcriptional activator|uniref:IclR family transcriptional regulator domain-containing protein n=1 Tax=Sphingobium sp. JS3065 TaxID=2970925 RepID=UPI002263F64E|nr:IclR family transcriptional regulator C-terminal domain-containing protein [Sphingobium sp. JS3065]UZW57224.1 helix-turn-helix domain-containing protein [Sphingobium sp. JS3065]